MKKLPIKYIPLISLGIFLIRCLIHDNFQLNDVLMIAILAGLTAFYEKQLESKAITELYKQMESLKEEVTKQVKVLADNDGRQENLLKETHNVISTMKIASGIRNVR